MIETCLKASANQKIFYDSICETILNHEHVNEKMWTEVLTVVYDSMKKNIMQIKWSADVKWSILDVSQHQVSVLQILLKTQEKTAKELDLQNKSCVHI